MSSRKPSSTAQRTPRREKLGAYTSPYIAKARAAALQRAREARKHLPRNGFVKNEWDSTPKSPGGVFDPNLKKKEIFRLEPRKPPQREAHEGNDSMLDRSGISDIAPRSQNPRMTMKTNFDSPHRRPATVAERSSARNQERGRAESGTPPSSRQASPSSSSRHSPPRSRSPPPPPPPPHPSSARIRHSPSPASSPHHSYDRPARSVIEPSSGDRFLDQKEVRFRQAEREQYSQALRDRLRAMLYQRLGLQEGEELNPMSRAQRRVVRTTSSYRQDEQAAMTRDIMANMAHIMKAVGDLVSNVAENNRARRKNPFRKSRPSRTPEPYPPHYERDEADWRGETAPLSHPPVPPPRFAVPPPPPPPSSSSSSPYRPAPLPPSSQPASDLAWDVAHAMSRPGKPSPRTKAGVLNLVLEKLQDIERSERELALYLQAHQRTALTLSDTTPAPSSSSTSLGKSTPRPEAKGLTAAAIREATGEAPRPPRISNFPKLMPSDDRNASTYDYMRELQSARRLREVPFEARRASLAITVDTVTDAIYERMLHSAAQDLEHLVDDYSANFLTSV